MREKYESLALTELKALAKVRGMKGISTLKKAALVEAMLAEDEKDKKRQTEKESASNPQENPPDNKQKVRKSHSKRKVTEPESIESEGDKSKSIQAKSVALEDDKSKSIQAKSAESESDKPKNIQPENDESEVDKTKNIRPESVESESVKPKSARPKRGRPESIKSKNIKSESDKSEGAKPESARPESAKSESARLESNRPKRGRPVSAKIEERHSKEKAKPESARTESSRSEYSKPEGGRAEYPKPEGGRAEYPKLESGRPEYPKLEGNRPESSKPEGSRPEYLKSEGSRPEYPKPESGRAEYVKPEGSRPEYPRPEGGRPEYSRQEDARTESSRQEDARADSRERRERTYRTSDNYDENQYPRELDSGVEAMGILEVMPDGYGFIRCENYMPGENDVYVAPSQIRRFGLKTGDILRGNKRVKTQQEKFSALLFIRTINGYTLEESAKRTAFEDMTPIFPEQRIRLETQGCSIAMRVMDLICPVGKGQRGMIVSPPKAGKTTLLKDVAKSILRTNPQMHMLILLIDERPEEVTDIKEAIIGNNVEVVYSTFDELPEHHKRVSEMAIERAKRLVEHKKDVVILLDSITRLTRAYNQVVPPSGRTLSGGLDPSALHMPKRFFGAARNMREGGSLTILATALVDTGSKMDDVVYEEFKGTGNMEMVLDRKLSDRRIFPAIDIQKSSTRREDLLLSGEELEAISIIRRALNSMKAEEATDRILDMFARTRSNHDFVNVIRKNRFI